MSMNSIQPVAKTTRTLPAQMWAALLVATLLALLASGCYDPKTGEANVGDLAEFTLPAFPGSGAHAVVVFSEMHYSPSARSQEGPRLLPPDDSVPVTGREIRYSSLAEYALLDVPSGVNGQYSATTAGELYRVNCSVCHGVALRGDGSMVQFMQRGPLPSDLMSDIAIGSEPGEVFAFITEGGRQGYAATSRGRASSSPMPAFKPLLSEEERWMLVKYLRDAQGQ